MVYVVCLMAIALVALLISAFYRRTLKQPAPRAGFVATLALGACFLLGYVLGAAGALGAVIRQVQWYCLLGSGIASMYGSLTLYFTLGKVRK
jgi:4-hydroxybenzoate polyprenyltransferase